MDLTVFLIKKISIDDIINLRECLSEVKRDLLLEINNESLYLEDSIIVYGNISSDNFIDNTVKLSLKRQNIMNKDIFEKYQSLSLLINEITKSEDISIPELSNIYNFERSLRTDIVNRKDALGVNFVDKIEKQIQFCIDSLSELQDALYSVSNILYSLDKCYYIYKVNCNFDKEKFFSFSSMSESEITTMLGGV